ncbi:hypothetical protein GCM10010123_25720 [Pilimelia anulata]|uniref:Peptidoglycan binding-like domain-containing protein n=1 Tax=Pilimelia anulata TaxID=53371 RepID=A0A8J3FD58_9ACTN|nr:hypothetical protein GCM10010123_25720 [Pilimelia anulata]
MGLRVGWHRVDLSGSDAAASTDHLLMSAGCGDVISMGQHDECVEEVQRLLAKAGATLSVDADFGPETLRRVTAFQVLAGLTPKGVVNAETKRALYAGAASLRTWPAAEVEARIRREFPEEPERAVRIARCHSFLDPLYVLPNANGTRNWGVFQLSDQLMRRYEGSPKLALEPEWNIRTARRAWAEHRDFRHWQCDKAAAPHTPTPTPSGSDSPGKAGS